MLYFVQQNLGISLQLRSNVAFCAKFRTIFSDFYADRAKMLYEMHDFLLSCSNHRQNVVFSAKSITTSATSAQCHHTPNIGVRHSVMSERALPGLTLATLIFGGRSGRQAAVRHEKLL